MELKYNLATLLYLKGIDTTCDVFNNTGVDSVDGYTVEKLIEEFRKSMKTNV